MPGRRDAIAVSKRFNLKITRMGYDAGETITLPETDQTKKRTRKESTDASVAAGATVCETTQVDVSDSEAEPERSEIHVGELKKTRTRKRKLVADDQLPPELNG